MVYPNSNPDAWIFSHWEEKQYKKISKCDIFLATGFEFGYAVNALYFKWYVIRCMVLVQAAKLYLCIMCHFYSKYLACNNFDFRSLLYVKSCMYVIYGFLLSFVRICVTKVLYALDIFCIYIRRNYPLRVADTTIVWLL